MNIKQILLASVTVMLLFTGNALAEKNNNYQKHSNYVQSHDDRNSGHTRASEIDAASGASKLALLAGALLLAGEISRSRRS